MSIQARYLFGITSSLLAAFTISLVVVSTRALKEVHFSILAFHYSFLTTIIMTFACLIWFIMNLCSDEENKDWPFIYDSAMAYIMVLFAAITNLIAMNLMTVIN